MVTVQQPVPPGLITIALEAAVGKLNAIAAKLGLHLAM